MVLPRGKDNQIPPRTLIMDVTMTHDRYGGTTQHTNAALTHRISSNDTPHPDGVLKNVAMTKIKHHRQQYADRSDPIVFLSVAVITSGHVYDDFVRLFFFHTHRETVFWPENYMRNLSSFVSSKLHAWRISRAL